MSLEIWSTVVESFLRRTRYRVKESKELKGRFSEIREGLSE
jgi:hypothetical protein